MPAIRPEAPEDISAIHHVNKQVFGRENEAKLVDKLRNRGVLTISLVAVQDSEIVGHIAFSPVIVETGRSSFEAITLAPLVVLPAYQRKGIGSQLVGAGLEECRHLGHEIVVLVGHPDYYPRFGFVRAKTKGLECEFEVPNEAWMVLVLRGHALAGRRGTVRFQPEFKEAV
ncbi:MAG: N-acetyltransferase [Chloroflexi bacterium]|nr:N-acetyltransferase [Chloroflexota bacterium]